MKSREIKSERISKIFQELLFRYINTDINNLDDCNTLEHITEKLSTLLEDDEYKSIFKKNILSLSKLFEGDIKKKLEKLYFELGLFSQVIEQLESKNWHTKLKALNELKELRMSNTRNELKKLLNDSNERVSIGAMQSIMELDQHPFRFLLEYSNPLSQAQSIYIAKKAANMEECQFKDVVKLFKHKEISITKLGIKLSQILNIKEAIPDLIKFLDHENSEIKLWAFISLAHIDPYPVFEILYNFCKNSPHELLNAILKKSDSQYVKIPGSVLNLINNTLNSNQGYSLA